MLKKELHEVKERFSSLELVEQELLHQLERKECENSEIKDYLQDIESKLHLK